MSTLLAEALGQLNLQPGQTYRTTIQEYEVEVRRRSAVPEKPPVEEQSQFEDGVMMDLWLVVPPSPAARIVSATRGAPQLPRPLQIEDSDLAPE